MIKILKLIVIPIVILPMIMMAYLCCIMTWGLTSFRYNFDYLWNDYWGK